MLQLINFSYFVLCCATQIMTESQAQISFVWATYGVFHYCHRNFMRTLNIIFLIGPGIFPESSSAVIIN